MPAINGRPEHVALATVRPPRRVLIIEGSSGIGRATVQRFARGGDQVWFTYCSEQQRALALAATDQSGTPS